MGMKKGPMIAQGRTAEVFLWGDGQVLKLFHEWFRRDLAEREVDVGRKLNAMGLPVPVTEEIVEVDGRLGIVYERVDGPSMVDVAITRPWMVVKLARLLAELQAALHTHKVSGFPSQREWLQGMIHLAEPLSANQRERMLQALCLLPDDNALCHMDLHPDQIVMTARGPVIIDWMSGTQGHPLADVAWTSMLFRVGVAPFWGWFKRGLIGMFRALFHTVYLRRYLALRPGVTRAQINAWVPVVAAARLGERIEEGKDKERLLALVEASLPPQS